MVRHTLFFGYHVSRAGHTCVHNRVHDLDGIHEVRKRISIIMHEIFGPNLATGFPICLCLFAPSIRKRLHALWRSEGNVRVPPHH